MLSRPTFCQQRVFISFINSQNNLWLFPKAALSDLFSKGIFRDVRPKFLKLFTLLSDLKVLSYISVIQQDTQYLMINFIHNIQQLNMFRTSIVHLQERSYAVRCNLVCLDTSCCYEGEARKQFFLHQWFFPHAATDPSVLGPPHYQGFMITDSRNSVELLWRSDQPKAETSSWQHTTLKRNRYPCPRRDSNTKFNEASGCGTTP